MDEHYYGRYAMAGWVVVAVVVSACLEVGIPSQGIEHLVEAGPGEEGSFADLITPGATLLVAVLAGLIGIGAPPAVGFLLQHVSSGILLWIPGAQMWTYSSVKNFKCAGHESQDHRGGDGVGMFHVCYYSCATKEMLAWARRRHSHMYASLNAFWAIVAGLLVVQAIWSAVPGMATRAPLVTIRVSAVFGALLLLRSYREFQYHRETIAAWVEAHTGMPRSISRSWDTRLLRAIRIALWRSGMKARREG